MNFHTSQRAVIGFAFFGYLALTLLIAILPAASVQGTPGLPGVAAPSALAEEGRVIYLREGCGYCHTQFVRDLPLDRRYCRGTVAAGYAYEDSPLAGSGNTGQGLFNVWGCLSKDSGCYRP